MTGEWSELRTGSRTAERRMQETAYSATNTIVSYTHSTFGFHVNPANDCTCRDAPNYPFGVVADAVGVRSIGGVASIASTAACKRVTDWSHMVWMRVSFPVCNIPNDGRTPASLSDARTWGTKRRPHQKSPTATSSPAQPTKTPNSP